MEVVFSPKYRKGSLVTTFIACSFFFSGVSLIPIVSNVIFSKTKVNLSIANGTISIMALCGTITGLFISKNVNSRNIFLMG